MAIDPTVEAHLGDCREVMAGLPAFAADACITDPPYELGFMGKRWDASGVAYQAETWAGAFRLLKPGAYLLAFGGTRTHHRMVCAIEDAGFEIRDAIEWIYGSGFPKSLDVGRAIDMVLCTEPGRHFMRKLPPEKDRKPGDHVCPETAEGDKYRGEGTGLKPAHEPIVIARKPLKGSIAENVLEYGAGGLRIEVCRVGSEVITQHIKDMSVYHSNKLAAGMPTPEKIGETQTIGRWPPNLVFSHGPDCELIGSKRIAGYMINRWEDGAKPFGGGAGHPFESEQMPDSEVEIWKCAGGCPVLELDRQSGTSQSAVRKGGPGGSGLYEGGFGDGAVGGYTDEGGASRYFPCFRYEPKAARSEREAGCEHLPKKSPGECTDREDGSAGLTPRAGAGRSGGARNYHPTVKPVKLCRWLVRLVTPKAGVILDPFMGSGTTGIAAYEEGCSFIGIENDPGYFEIANARIKHARRQRKLF